MKSKWKALSRSTQVLVVVLFLATGVVAYAAISTLVTSFWGSNWSKKGFVEIEITVPAASGNVGPGDTMTVSPTITNNGNDDGLAFIKFTYPTISNNTGMSGSAYTWTEKSGWSVIEQGIGYTVYGYSSPLGEYETTGELLESVTMKDMTGAEYKAIDDVNIRFDGYLADVNEYGSEANQGVWIKISGGGQ